MILSVLIQIETKSTQYSGSQRLAIPVLWLVPSEHVADFTASIRPAAAFGLLEVYVRAKPMAASQNGRVVLPPDASLNVCALVIAIPHGPGKGAVL